ncbi:MAG TPA: helix-turn-helix domain-containing protein [Solirubrobacter sp.]|nr:helix-turn-helix domain-containing protein [Solirubrobacter sp.]
MSTTRSGSLGPRERIVLAAARLLAEGGAEAMTTRAVEAAAGVQAPAIYRLFGDKRGLLEAVAEHQYGEFVRAKAAGTSDDADRDPIEVLREAWRANVQFGLDNPALFALMNGEGRPGERWAAVELGYEILHARVERIAAAGRLRVGEQRAIHLIVASARGAVLTLNDQPAEERDLGLLDDVLDGLVAMIAIDGPAAARDASVAVAANALRVALRTEEAGLTPGETALLDELLVRLSSN